MTFNIQNYVNILPELNVIGPRYYVGTSLDDHMEILTNGIIPKIYKQMTMLS